MHALPHQLMQEIDLILGKANVVNGAPQQWTKLVPAVTTYAESLSSKSALTSWSNIKKTYDVSKVEVLNH